MSSNLITRNIEGIARMTEDTSLVTEEVAASATRLEQLASTLKHVVGPFKR